MKLQVLQENLSNSLNIASRFTSSRAQLPVLANILLSAKSNKLYLSATNLENSVSLTIGAKVEKEGEITVPARVINDVVSSLNPGAINLTSAKEQVKISSDGFSSTISGINASDFPQVPKKVSKDAIKFPKDEFISSLNQVLFATSSDETRPLLTGVLFLFESKSLSLVSTDGFRLSRKKIPFKLLKEESQVILPKGVLSEISRLNIEEDNIYFSYKKTDNQVVFRAGNTVLSSRVLEGEFPDFKKIIPKTSEIKVSINKGDFAQAVKLASVFARDSANIIKLLVEKDSVTVSAESQYSGSQSSKVEAKVDGNGNFKDNLEIAFNYRFLEEYINIVEGEDIEISFSNANSPGVFSDPKNKKLLHLIMPVKLQT